MYAWMFFSVDGRLCAGADPFGIFPVYHFEAKGVVGIATGLAALRLHPAYDATIDEVGLVRYLIENGSAGPRTPERSGRRLEIGAVLHANPSDGSLWIRPGRIPRPDRSPKTASAREAVEQVTEATRSAVRRHFKRPPDFAMLSGGLDSRQVVSLAVEAGYRPICFTAGRPSDYEAMFARRVARSLDLEWRCGDDRLDGLRAEVEDCLRLQSLGGGFSTVTLNAARSCPGLAGARFTGGIVLDAHYAPYTTALDRSRYSLHSFDYAFEQWVNRFGLRPAELRELAADASMRDAVEAALAEIRAEWEAVDLEGNDRLWWTLMRSRARPHLGGHTWQSSFHAWPVLPGLDLPLAEAIRGVADEHFEGRWLQRESFRSASPGLARIPLAGMSHSPRAIVPSLGGFLQRKLLGLRAKRLPREQRSQLHRFVRSLHPDAACWRLIRDLVEPYRERLHPYFEPEALARFLPKPDKAILPDGSVLRGQGGRRLLYGLMLWMERRNE